LAAACANAVFGDFNDIAGGRDMAQRSTGQVVERQWKAGPGLALRFNAYGERRYVTLGLAADGWTRPKAQEELENILADVRRGIWIPPANQAPKPGSSRQAPSAQGFHEFATSWLAGREGAVSQGTVDYETWALEHHLLPYFAEWALVDIDISAVDEYRRFKVRQAAQRREAMQAGTAELDRAGQPLRPLAPGTINKTIDVLQAVLALADEYDLIPTNPAVGRRRRLKLPPRASVHLDSVDHIQALLDAARELDADPRRTTRDRYAQTATLIFAGPRAHEHCGMRWRDLDLANGRVNISRSKTQAGLREIILLQILHAALREHRRNSTHTQPNDLVFPTATGGMRDKDNLRNRVLEPVIRRANELLAQRELPPLPEGLTPHKLRHTFASILVAIDEDPVSVMGQLGHTDPKFTLRVYAHIMRRSPEQRVSLKALVNSDGVP
jgi:integrase